MLRIIIRNYTPIPPFGEPARELRIMNKPLWLLQRDLLKVYATGMTEVSALEDIPNLFLSNREELFVHEDNLYFNQALLDAFISEAKTFGKSCQIAFALTDGSISQSATQLSSSIVRRNGAVYRYRGKECRGDVYTGEMYYFPNGFDENATPLVIETLSHEMGYYNIPSYMASKGELTYQVPLRAFLSIEHWLHVFMANVVFGVFSMAATTDVRLNNGRLTRFFQWSRIDWRDFIWKAKCFFIYLFLEKFNPLAEGWRKHWLSTSEAVKVGKNCSIDPSAIIYGPSIIGDNVHIGPGVVITNSVIGNNVNIMQSVSIMLSVVSDRCFIPVGARIFMSSLMENSIAAQNATVQLCVIGRNSFIGANNCFTDFNLLGEPIKVVYKGRLVPVKLPLLGSAVGHNCKIASGFVVLPGRMIETNTVIINGSRETVIRKTVRGHALENVDELTGEPRRIVYQFPQIIPTTQDGLQGEENS